ncbi:MAG: holo-ACP synthase [Dehalococcoidales bacterium]|nr:holo-ACP synthase [Dehalococcoidales bacterium]
MQNHGGTFSIGNEALGIGTDIESVARFEAMRVENNGRLLARIFTEEELDYCLSRASPAEHLAARFAAKEAVIKALGSLELGKAGYKDIEITGGENGAPRASVKGYSNIRVMVSLSHTRELAIAVAIAVKHLEA